MTYAQLADGYAKTVALDAAMGGVASDDPDLSVFWAHGHKFIGTHGWNDEAIPIEGTIHYYETMVKKMGGAAKVQSFFRLYLAPGGGHESPQGTSNPDAHPPKIPSLYPQMVAWVEKGIAPDRIDIATPSDPFAPTNVKITQPVCPYPQKATYISGDPKVASSFVCR